MSHEHEKIVPREEPVNFIREMLREEWSKCVHDPERRTGKLRELADKFAMMDDFDALIDGAVENAVITFVTMRDGDKPPETDLGEKLSKDEAASHKPVFEVFPDVESKWRWRLVAANHEITAQSEAYEGGKSAACIGAATTKRIAAEADIVVVEA